MANSKDRQIKGSEFPGASRLESEATIEVSEGDKIDTLEERLRDSSKAESKRSIQSEARSDRESSRRDQSSNSKSSVNRPKSLKERL